MLIINSFLERTIGWETGCDVYALLGAISGMGQAITNAAIAFDRYRSALSIFYHFYWLLLDICIGRTATYLLKFNDLCIVANDYFDDIDNKNLNETID